MIHSAKATDAPTCYIIRLEPGMYPHIRSLGDADQEEEERRILYVAMTRAMYQLIITSAYEYGGFGVLHDNQRGHYSTGRSGYFLQGLPEDLVEHCYISSLKRLGGRSRG